MLSSEDDDDDDDDTPRADPTDNVLRIVAMEEESEENKQYVRLVARKPWEHHVDIASVKQNTACSRHIFIFIAVSIKGARDFG
jgi:hypothetical protein